MGKRVELIHPPHYNSLPDRLDVPFGLLTIAAALREAVPDVKTTITDLTGVNQEDWRIGEADVYGITVYAASLGAMRDIVADCRAKNSEARIVIGGAHPSSDPFLADYNTMDHVVVGMGEGALIEIMNGNGDVPRVIQGEFERFYLPAYDLDRKSVV